MSRHAKNNTASSYFTYAERQKLKYGTQKQRVGRDSLPNFDWCNLTLATAVQPVVTPVGYVYSKEAIYENFLQQKKEIERKKQLWEEQQKRLLNDAQKKEDDAKLAEVEKFIKSENAVALPLPEKERKRQTDRTEEEELKARVREHAKNLRAYWVPGKAPSAEESLLPKPSSKTHDPMSNDPVRLKDLLPIEFTPVQNVNVREADKIGRWMCPVCFTILSNRVKLTALRTSGKVMCHGCYEKFVVPEMKDPITGKRVRDKDVIHLKSPGTGFSAGSESATLVATKVDTAFVG
ncbi:nitric oxide synthase interacting family protein [Acanthamoeba castellanii str. Neff]|uniref:Nitric oxide synthase-interacting protein homolog n=1 Tax=Acanthamoeba castellanii (strain ATCC 30010 / Neff) TaxID=1257118 RepID=L8GFN7_ACACF|nr:nitric oxide synthase interacting family protein [Acanthamoeba castellanii str. Neff]ELR11654.1 nitric oxide synthase interacting family protein [Acanthamoeba castellanii str. Neff]